MPQLPPPPEPEIMRKPGTASRGSNDEGSPRDDESILANKDEVTAKDEETVVEGTG